MQLSPSRRYSSETRESGDQQAAWSNRCATQSACHRQPLSSCDAAAMHCQCSCDAATPQAAGQALAAHPDRHGYGPLRSRRTQGPSRPLMSTWHGWQRCHTSAPRPSSSATCFNSIGVLSPFVTTVAGRSQHMSHVTLSGGQRARLTPRAGVPLA